MPFCNSEEYPIRMLTFNLQCGIVYRYDTCRCPAVEEGWDVNLSYGFWEALCPDCAKDAEE